MPGTPTRVTSCGGAVDPDARERAEQERPLLVTTDEWRGGVPAGSPTRPTGSRASHTGTGSALPFASTGSCAR